MNPWAGLLISRAKPPKVQPPPVNYNTPGVRAEARKLLLNGVQIGVVASKVGVDIQTLREWKTEWGMDYSGGLLRYHKDLYALLEGQKTTTRSAISKSLGISNKTAYDLSVELVERGLVRICSAPRAKPIKFALTKFGEAKLSENFAL